ncbi:MAG TPA: replication factor C large subunit [Euryarchaeota archaeon]|nr:replication factor C large subunit [Euryarchaeota archaeon]
MLLWVEKYRPQKLSDLVGNPRTLARLSEWTHEFKDGVAKKKALLLHGPPGSGKTSAALALSEELGFELVETNASDVRTKDAVERKVGFAASLASLDPESKGKIILIDEVDGIHGRSDFGGLAAVKKIIKSSKEPVILLANDAWSLPADFRALCELLEFKRIDRRAVLKVLKRIAEEEGVVADEKALSIISSNANGDLRSAINDLQSLGHGGRIAVSDLSSLFMRDSELSIFKALAQIFKTDSCDRAREAMFESDEDPETLFNWISENVPLEYEDPEDLAQAYHYLSRADIFLGRIRKRQDWRLLGYASDLMSCGVAVSKKRRYNKFIRYKYPQRFAMLARTRARRNLVGEIATKISHRCHVSSKLAATEFIPLLESLFRDVGKAAELSSYFGFNQKDIEFFQPDSAKKIHEIAEKISAERITPKTLQTSLF